MSVSGTIVSGSRSGDGIVAELGGSALSEGNRITNPAQTAIFTFSFGDPIAVVRGNVINVANIGIFGTAKTVVANNIVNDAVDTAYSASVQDGGGNFPAP